VLNAIIHGKSGRVNLEGEATSISWKQLYKKREDLLTAAFFSRFTYLSGLIQHRLLKSWLGGEGDFTEFKSVEYWPRYDLPKPKGGSVEPDLLLSFDSCDVLIEVKPPQGGPQYLGQWKKEIAGYFEQDADIKPLYFLAVGRVETAPSEEAIKETLDHYEQLSSIKAIGWKPIAHGLYELQRSHALDAQDRRVVTDMLQALELYGVAAYELKWKDIAKLYDDQLLDHSLIESWALEPKK
jgi:hypothetical protein